MQDNTTQTTSAQPAAGAQPQVRATYAKLYSGAWGIRVSATAAPEAGAMVTVQRRDGQQRHETVLKVEHQVTVDQWICSIVQRARTPRARSGQLCPQCGSEPLGNDGRCWECGYTVQRFPLAQ